MSKQPRPDMAGPAYPYRREIPRVFTGWSRPFASHGGHRDEANTALVFHRRPDNGQPIGVDMSERSRRNGGRQNEGKPSRLLSRIVYKSPWHAFLQCVASLPRIARRVSGMVECCRFDASITTAERLVPSSSLAQDGTLSRCRHGFKSRWDHQFPLRHAR